MEAIKTEMFFSSLKTGTIIERIIILSQLDSLFSGKE